MHKRSIRTLRKKKSGIELICRWLQGFGAVLQVWQIGLANNPSQSVSDILSISSFATSDTEKLEEGLHCQKIIE